MPSSTGARGNEELVDQAAVQVLLDRLGAGDADVAVAGRLAGPVEGALDAVVDEVEGGAARPLPRLAPGVGDDEHPRRNGASFGHASSPASNMRLPMLLTPVRSNVARAMSLSSPSALAELEVSRNHRCGTARLQVGDYAAFVASDRASAMTGAIANPTSGAFVD